MQTLTGALLVDKPAGPTSHDVVSRARRVLGGPRIGHTGTLDPLATGLLVLLVGPVTRLAQFLVSDVKEYLADVRLGIATDTYDAEGLDPATRGNVERLPSSGDIAAALDRFRGTFQQTPPPYSAKKVAGRACVRGRARSTVRRVTACPGDGSRARAALLFGRSGAPSGRVQRRLLHTVARARPGPGARVWRSPRRPSTDEGGSVLRGAGGPAGDD